jgi:hypothetical protein
MEPPLALVRKRCVVLVLIESHRERAALLERRVLRHLLVVLFVGHPRGHCAVLQGQRQQKCE